MPVLTLNAGSSSVRFAFYGEGGPAAKLLDGKIERIGLEGAALILNERGKSQPERVPLSRADPSSADEFLLDWLQAQPWFADVDAVGHRVVHGLHRTSPERVTPRLLQDLEAITPYDPEHMPREIELMRAIGGRFPTLAQVACFDTAFHRSMPRVATQLPIPRRLESKGVQRYGFHGLSYTYLMQELMREGDPAAAHGRVILGHLGSGASLAAVRNGRCIDTTMGFTPTAGLPMSTRSGDLDPGVMSYLAIAENMDAEALRKMVNHESGLLGISETSADIRDLLAREADDIRAAEAVNLFCYQTRKWIAGFAGVLGGLDTLVFAGGIGENSAPVRRRICDGLQFLGIEIDEALNAGGAPSISGNTSKVAVRVIRTDEESIIAAMTIECLQGDSRK